MTPCARFDYVVDSPVHVFDPLRMLVGRWFDRWFDHWFDRWFNRLFDRLFDFKPLYRFYLRAVC